MDKQQAKYEVPAKANDTCSQCKHFCIDSSNSCSKVDGLIKPEGWCTQFVQNQENFMDEFFRFAKHLADRD